MYAFFGDFTHFAKAEDLKATRVGQDRLVPVHEFMQATELIDDISTRAQPKMKGIAKDNVGANGGIRLPT